MASFSTTVRPTIEHPPHEVDEDAVDLTDTIELSGPVRPRKNTSAIERDGSYELHSLQAHLGERVRRPSAVRLESSATMSFKDGMSESPTTALEQSDPLNLNKTYIPMATAIPGSQATGTANLTNTFNIRAQAVNVEASKKMKRASRWQFFAACWCLFLNGWNDGTTGPLLPVIQEHYGIGFTFVSFLFVFACIGFVLGATANVWLNDKIGFGKVVLLGSLFQVVSYAIDSPAPPFPVMVFAYFLGSFGIALQYAQCNGFIGSLREHKTTKMGLLHAVYGVGATIAPLVATRFSVEPHWSYHYIISTGIAVSNTVVLALVFRGKRQEDLLAEAGQEPLEGEDSLSAGRNLYRAIMGIKSVHYMAIFALIYIGTEVTLGGWIVTFIINERGGGKSAGNISSGFFGGLTVGRFALIWVNKKIGEHRVVFLYSFIAIALELTVWFVPSVIENALAVSFIGVLLGPMFPILLGHASRILPGWLLTGCVGWITAIGMTGSAAMPFFTGLLASKYGIRSLQPLVVSMMCTMVGLWALIPRAPRRIE